MRPVLGGLSGRDARVPGTYDEITCLSRYGEINMRDITGPIAYGLLLCLIAASSGQWWAYLPVILGWEVLLWVWCRDLEHQGR